MQPRATCSTVFAAWNPSRSTERDRLRSEKGHHTEGAFLPPGRNMPMIPLLYNQAVPGPQARSGVEQVTLQRTTRSWLATPRRLGCGRTLPAQNLVARVQRFGPHTGVQESRMCLSRLRIGARVAPRSTAMISACTAPRASARTALELRPPQATWKTHPPNIQGLSPAKAAEFREMEDRELTCAGASDVPHTLEGVPTGRCSSVALIGGKA